MLPQAGGDLLTQHDVYVHGQTIQLPNWQGWAKGAPNKLNALAQGARLPEVGPHAPGLAMAARRQWKLSQHQVERVRLISEPRHDEVSALVVCLNESIRHLEVTSPAHQFLVL